MAKKDEKPNKNPKKDEENMDLFVTDDEGLVKEAAADAFLHAS